MISIEPLKRTSRVTVLQYGMYQQQSTQLTNSKSSSCKDAVPNPYPTCEENRTQLINSDSESCKDVVPYLQKYMYPNRINEEVFKGKNSLEIKSSSSEQDVGPQSPKVEVPEEKKESENLDKKFELFTESEEAEVLLTDIVPQNKQTPHDPTH
ncbi:MAG TPA: hypothetical protein ENI20_08475 [Bacteroides sp.]|nr:hypothetical protein [Bacteroides sp.]